LKIDPAQVPQPDTGEADSANAKPERARQPTLIRMTVFNKREGTFDLKVNVPVAFARMLIEALGESQRRELRRGAREQGIDIDDIFDAIQKSGAGRLLEVDSEDSLIEIWIE
jgi:hypothetical protein